MIVAAVMKRIENNTPRQMAKILELLCEDKEASTEEAVKVGSVEAEVVLAEIDVLSISCSDVVVFARVREGESHSLVQEFVLV